MLKSVNAFKRVRVHRESWECCSNDSIFRWWPWSSSFLSSRKKVATINIELSDVVGSKKLSKHFPIVVLFLTLNFYAFSNFSLRKFSLVVQGKNLTINGPSILAGRLNAILSRYAFWKWNKRADEDEFSINIVCPDANLQFRIGNIIRIRSCKYLITSQNINWKIWFVITFILYIPKFGLITKNEFRERRYKFSQM